jgi:hypothetical protein
MFKSDSGRNHWLASAAVCLVLACGARAAVEPSADGEDPGGGVGSGGSTAPGVGGSGPSAPGDDGVEILPDPCPDSFRRSDERDRACPYIYRGVCYSSGDCACSNACGTEEQCVIEGFLAPDDTQRVRCISPE